jgi:UDP-N-acetylmuramate-alanine ligase
VAAATADAAPGRPVAWMPGFDQARALLHTWLEGDDVCLVMGAGNIDSLARSLIA